MYILTERNKDKSMNRDKPAHNYYTWNISKGDYIRDHECTTRYERYIKKKERLLKLSKTVGVVTLILVVVITTISFIFF